MAVTQRFGLTKTADNDVIDRVLALLEEHRHDGGSGATGMADPTEAPTGTVQLTGGTIGNGVDLYYRVSFIDGNGLETVASDELHVEMPAIPVVDAEPILTGDTGAGTLPPDTYFYALTANSAAGETALGPQSIITVVPGQNQVVLALPELPDLATSFNVWRQGTGEEGWTEVGQDVTDPSWTDTGVVSADCACDPATQPPDSNSGTASNSVVITCPDAAVIGADPSPIAAWRIYRTEISGVYGDSSLLAQIVETTTDSGGPLLTTYTDTGANTITGSPTETSTSVHPSRPVVLDHGTVLPTDVTGLVDYTPFVLKAGSTFELYVLEGGTWHIVAGGGGGGGGGGGADAVLAAGPLAFVTGNVPYALTPNTDFVPEVTPAAESLDQSGVDVRPGSDGPAGWDGLGVYAAGDYAVEIQAHVTGLVPGDVVRLTIAGATAPNFLTSDITVPNGQTEIWASLAHVVNMAYPSGSLVFGRVNAFTEQAAPSLEYWSLGMQMSRGTPTDPTGLPDAPTGVAATPAGPGALQVVWTAPAGDVVDYQVVVNGIRYTGTGSCSLTVSGLSPGAEYGCTIAARNAIGYGPSVSFNGITSS